ncbi:unnamed protein product [Owenia fusiformis]|uniref:C2H2-type domain-containing protein n=1 Tax=Owenia fusiformis TaxID=6347 RepID=A0A8J1UML8_OWEFU|nr:unnamed protein product [Owenia fusiformis]CAH1793866.1 unnamed protein product [Owenia fusiformis]
MPCFTGPRKCMLCGERFQDQPGLVMHMKAFHRDVLNGVPDEGEAVWGRRHTEERQRGPDDHRRSGVSPGRYQPPEGSRNGRMDVMSSGSSEKVSPGHAQPSEGSRRRQPGSVASSGSQEEVSPGHAQPSEGSRRTQPGGVASSGSREEVSPGHSQPSEGSRRTPPGGVASSGPSEKVSSGHTQPSEGSRRRRISGGNGDDVKRPKVTVVNPEGQQVLSPHTTDDVTLREGHVMEDGLEAVTRKQVTVDVLFPGDLEFLQKNGYRVSKMVVVKEKYFEGELQSRSKEVLDLI